MRCCASSTTSTAAEPAAPPAVSIVEATLFAQALRPLAAGMGFMGDIVVDTAARELFLAGLARRGDARS